MSAAKDHIKQLLNSLPDDSSYDEIIKEIAFERMIERGLDDSRNDRIISNQEMEHRIKSWGK